MIDKKYQEIVKKHCLCGQPTKFIEEKHIPLLIDIFSKGESIASFCAEALIDKGTFRNWLKIHPIFKFTYDIVINIAEKIWESYPQINPEMNHQYWFMIMKNRFGFGKPQLDIVEDKTPKGRIENIWSAIEKGSLSTEEISKIASLAVMQANIENNLTINPSGFEVRESRESLIEKINKIQEVIDFVQKEEK